MQGVRRLPDGGLRVRLTTREREVLRSLPEQLRPILTGEHDPAGVRGRLFSRAYDDPADEAEYRALVGDAAAQERVAALDTFARTLEGGEAKRVTWTVELSADDAQAWLSAVNDVRLTLAALAGIDSEDAWERGPDRGDPSSVVLWYLGWLEEEILQGLASSLPEAE